MLSGLCNERKSEVSRGDVRVHVQCSHLVTSMSTVVSAGSVREGRKCI